MADYFQPLILLLFVIAATHIHEQQPPLPLVRASAPLNKHYIAFYAFTILPTSLVVPVRKLNLYQVIFFMGESSKGL